MITIPFSTPLPRPDTWYHRYYWFLGYQDAAACCEPATLADGVSETDSVIYARGFSDGTHDRINGRIPTPLEFPHSCPP